MISQERWNTFSKSQQIGHIGAELMRAKVWQDKKREYFLDALTQGMALIHLSLGDPKWQSEIHMLEGLRKEMEHLINGTSVYNVEILYNAL